MMRVPAAVNLASPSRIREPESACGDPGQVHASFRICHAVDGATW
jgi:hypothetical protein